MRSLNTVVVDARGVAVARISLGLATILIALETYGLFSRIGGGRLAIPVVAWMPAPTTSQAIVYLVIALAAGIALTIGYRAAAAAAISTVASAWVLLWDQQSYSSHRWLAMLLVACLIFAHSDATWSWTSARRAEPRSSVPWWPQLLMMTQLSACYLFAALSKNNPTFLSGSPLRQWIRWDMPRSIVIAMAFGTIFAEVFLALGLWAKRTRVLAVLVGVALHISILVLLRDYTWELIAFTLSCVGLYPLYFARPRKAPATAMERSPLIPSPSLETAAGT